MNHIEKKNLAINYLKDINSKEFNYWNHLYCFSTENLTDYFNEELLKNKKVLITGSSADQIIISQLYEAKTITHYDLNPYVKYLYDLKIAAIKSLTLDEYLDFFCFEEGYNYNSFSLEKYILIRKNLEEDSLDFWDSLFKEFPSYEIRNNLFFIYDEEKNKNNYKNFLPYLTKENYNKLKKMNNFTKVEFIETNILNLNKNLNNKYDLIYFSNIFSRFEMSDFHNKRYIKNLYELINQTLKHTEEDGIILLNYLYNCQTKDIYNFDIKYLNYIRFPIKMFNCQNNMIYFEVPTICSYGECPKDTVIGYQKKKTKI